MKLTREQAIAEHRKMWRWIADEIEKQENVLDIWEVKKRYFAKNGMMPIKNDCFLCGYTSRKQYYVKCEECPLDWGHVEGGLPCEGEAWSDNDEKYGLWWKCVGAKTWQEQAALARQIAELPESEDV